MAQGVSIQFDRRQLKKLVDDANKTGKSVGLTVQWMAQDLMRVSLNDAIKYTAPRGAAKVGGWKAQKEIGTGAVDHDLDRLFGRLDTGEFFIPFENQGRHFMRHKTRGYVFEVEQGDWMPDMKQAHMAARTRRGRVPKQRRQKWVGEADLKAYTKAVQARVGSLKAGWLTAARAFASVTGGKVSAPAWVKKHMTPMKMSSVYGITADGKGALYATNMAHHNEAIRESMIRYINGKRNQDLNKWLPLRMEKVVQRFNKGQAVIAADKTGRAA